MADPLRFVTVPKLIQQAFPSAQWHIPSHSKKIYLTFDDGPTPGVTDLVLQELKKYNAKATFFCIGKNAEKEPALLSSIIAHGHRIGNHSMNHLNGWKTDNQQYFEDIEKGRNVLEKSISSDEKMLYRPPYGKLLFSQYNYLKKKYQLVLWDVLSYDFDLKISKETVLKNSLKHSRDGSIIVFHDSIKAAEKLLYSLPTYLDYFSEKGYTFEKL